MSGILKIRITRSGGEIKDLRYRYIWSAWLDGRLLGRGYGFSEEEAEARAMNLVTDTVPPEQVEHIEVVQR